METWKPLHNFPSYNGSTHGRIMNIRTQHILSQADDENGNKKVCLRKNGKQYTVKVHKIIAETFLGDQPGMDVRHKDNDRSNNHIDNLEWCTRSETIKDAYDRGNMRARKYIRVKVIETGKIYDSISECARDLRCSNSSISKCLSEKLSNVKGYHFEEA